jgi:type 1 glutamine amidotransferase
MRVLLITRGHPFQREPFFAMFDDIAAALKADAGVTMEWFHAEQPAARAVFEPEYAKDFDAFVFYDMPGIRFGPGGPDFEVPTQRLKDNLAALTQSGKGLVFLHHAIAGWPAWPEYAELMGGRFLYLPAELRGRQRPDSGYRHAVTHRVRKVAEHPVTAGVPDSFEITDELYLFEVFDDAITPLLASDHGFVRDNFYSAARVVRDGKMYDNEGWAHEPGSNLVGWTRQQDASQVVYLQCGDDAVAYGNAHFRRLVGNAIRFVSGG